MADKENEVHKELAKKVNERWKQGLARRQAFDLETQTSLAMLYGENDIYPDYVTGMLLKRPNPRGGPSVNIPLVKSIWRSEVARLTKREPIPEVWPASNAEKDIEAAQIANRILQSELRRVKYTDLYLRLISWVTASGCSYLHPSWDKAANGGKGDVVVEVVPHTELVLDPDCRNNTDDAKWCIHGRVMSHDAAYERFGRKFKSSGANVDDFLNVAKRLEFGGIASTPSSGVLVLRYWLLPCRDYPNGYVCTVVDNELIEEESFDKFPYRHKVIPFIDFHHVRMPGRFAGQSILRDLWASQDDYNHSRSKMAEARNLMASPKVLALRGSMDGVERLSPLSGEVVEWDMVGPYEPKPLQLGTLPAFVFQTTTLAMQEMRDLSAVHEVSHGAVPGRTAAAAVSQLLEADESTHAAIVKGLEASVARYGKLHLELVQQYWAAPRLVKTWSDSDGGEYAKWVEEVYRGADIRGATDVQVIPGSGLAKSRRAEQDRIMEMWDKQVITDPDFVLKGMDVPGVSPLLSARNLDVQQAERENKKFMALAKLPEPATLEEEDMLKARLPMVEKWHNHQVHKRVINDFRKTLEFEELPDWLRAAVSEHHDRHEEFKIEAQMQELQAQLPQGGDMGALPIGEAAEVPMAAPPGNSPQMGEEIPQF